MSRLSRGQAALIARQQAGATPAGSLTYVRGAERTDLTGLAWVGRTLFSRLPSTAGVAVVWGDRDYLIPVAALAFTPTKGDRIEEVIGGQTLTFELLAPANEPAWRYSDPARTLYRCHVKQVGGAT